jgi:RHS repeat-associated protein
MVMKKVPGAAPVYMVYDQRDRLVMTQDGNLRFPPSGGQGGWMVTLYDELNRPIQTGLWYSTDSRTTHANNAQTSSNYYYPFTATTTPGSGWEKLAATHYDNYAGLPSPLSATFNNSWSSHFATASNSSYPYPQAQTATTVTRGLTTWTETKVLGTTNQFLTTVMIYDDKARPIQVQSTNITGGVDVATTQYSWAGQPLTTVQKTNKAGSNAQTHVVVTKMEYDDLGRVLNVKKAINSTVNSVAVTKAEQLIVQNTYDKLGQLKTKKLAPSFNSNAGLETIAYDYNIRGWMLGANRDYAKDNNNTNYFGFDLGYDKTNNGVIGNSTYNNPQYNGNIEGMVWKSKGDGEKRKYDFVYDAANRLLKADFTQYTNSSFNQDAGINFNSLMGSGGTLPNGNLDPTTAYDDNGNIKRIQQWGLKINSSSQIDDLAYVYKQNSNKLAKVTDAFSDPATKLGDFKDGTNVTNDDYVYDLNGSLTLDNNKGITSITYNHLNLPQTITLLPPPNSNNGSRNITYVYDAAGNKLKKEIFESTNLGANKKITTTYINGFVYDSKLTNQGGNPEADDYTDILQFIPQEEGRIRFKSATQSLVANFQYDYMLKDHLGNVRMVLTEEQQVNAYPPASMETAQSTTEEALYVGLSQTRIAKPAGYPTDTYTDPNNYVARVRAAAGSQQIGPSITLKVMAGDKFNVRVNSWYKTYGATLQQPVNVLTDLVTSLTSGVSNASTSSGHPVTITELNNNNNNILNPGVSTFLNNQTYNSAAPKAYLNWILFDEQLKVVINSSGFEQVGNNEEFKTYIKTDLPIDRSGYLYIYVSNATPNIDVFFDNLQVTHTRGALLEENSYYPFGLIQQGISSRAANVTPNKEKTFQGQRFDDELGLNWVQFKWRNHDPQIGRFIEIDPLSNEYVYNSTYAFSENQVIAHVELEGLEKVKFTEPSTWLNLENIISASDAIMNAATLKAMPIESGPSGSMRSTLRAEASTTIKSEVSTAIKTNVGNAIKTEIKAGVNILKTNATQEASSSNSVGKIPNITTLAEDLAASYRQKGGRTPTMAGAAVDVTTGATATAVSGKPLVKLEPALAERVPIPWSTPWAPGNCAEMKAANILVKQGSEVKNIQHVAVRIGTGKVEPPCKTCKAVLGDNK